MEEEKNDDESVESEKDTDNEEQDSENTEEEDTSKDDSDDSKDDSDENKDSEEEEKSSDSEEENPYEAKLKQLEEDNAELKKNKTAAIQEERKKRQEAETKLKEKEGEDSEDDSEDKPLTRKELDDIMLKRDNNQRIKEISSNESEEKLISKFVELGYNVDDAYLKANEHIIDEHKQAEREREEQEAITAGFSSPVARGKKGSPAYSTDPVKKAAADGLSPEERKYL